jgi:hypothetical protein
VAYNEKPSVETAGDEETDTADDSPGGRSRKAGVPQPDAVSDSPEERPDETDAKEVDSGWESPGIAEDVRRPDVEDIGITEDRRGHILDGESGNRGGTGMGPEGRARPSFPQTGTMTRRPATSSMSDADRRPWTCRTTAAGVRKVNATV